MPSRFGFTVLFGLIIIILLMQEKATNAVGLNAACTADANCDTPANTLVCDLSSTNDADHKCKSKNGTDCTGHENDCVDGASCSSSKQCICKLGRTPAAQNGACAAAPTPGTAGAECGTGALTCTAATTVCDAQLCRYKNGSDCSSHEDLCVNGARCQDASGHKLCVCGIGRTPAVQDGKCQAAPTPGTAGAPCGTGALTCTDATTVCDDNLCRYKNGSDCSSHEDLCVNGARCQDASGHKLCVCGIGRTPAVQDGKCQAAPTPGTAGAECGTGALTCTDATTVCDDNLCRYKNGSDCSSHEDLCVDGATCQGATGHKLCLCGIEKTPAAQDGKCQGVKSQSGSANLLTSLLLIISSVMSSCFL